MAGNKSGALLLTIFELSNGRGNFAFTMRDPHKLMPPGIADHSRGAHHKHLPEIAVTGFRDAAKRSFPPLEFCFGAKPIQAARAYPLLME